MLGKTTLVGIVERVNKVKPENGKPFVSIAIQDVVEKVIPSSGKKFRRRAELLLYRDDAKLEQAVADFQVGSLVMASGEPDAKPFTHNGKSYAKLTVMVDSIQSLSSTAPAISTPAPTSAPQPLVPKVNSGQDGDDVPF